jgi:osmotically inducible protein OsmC
MERKASAVWSGSLKEGNGTLSTESGVLNQSPYSFSRRFQNEKGTNPEELIAAAHAGCFAMALSGELGKLGLTASKLEATAAITLEQTSGGFSITKSHITLVAEIPGADKSQFDAAVNAAKVGCPVSRLLKAEVTVSAQLK